MEKSFLRMVGAAFVSVTLATCGPANHEIVRTEPTFDLSEIQALSAPVRAGTPPTTTPRALRKDAPKLARTYAEMLHRFDSIYGDGVGPAKRAPSYIACKQAFETVQKRIEAVPAAVSDADLDTAWGSLMSCRHFADRWSRATEMATFGEDLKTLTYGSMLVLGYVASASGSTLGPRFFTEADKGSQAPGDTEHGESGPAAGP
ncbi:hypothetical protein SAMN05518801_10228 [Novosphingobium sp. CF614]|nr:hypothetical protein SAMN05518801_10228 [Novosphingobium sp. CF614]